MESTATTTNENAVPSIASAKSKVGMTTDTAKYNADGSLASLSSTYPVDSARTGTDISEDPPTVSAIPAPRKDVWEEMSALRKALKASLHGGYLTKALVLTISSCCFVSVIIGAILAIPVIALVAAYDQVRSFFAKRKAAKEAASNLRVVQSGEVE